MGETNLPWVVSRGQGKSNSLLTKHVVDWPASWEYLQREVAGLRLTRVATTNFLPKDGERMMIAQKIAETVRELPPQLQQELLDFVEFLLLKRERQEAREWSAFSVAHAMQDMECEESPYTLADLKVVFK